MERVLRKKIERVMPRPKGVTVKRRAAANRKRLTEDNVQALPVRRHQYMVWDAGTDAARGLGVLVSPAGAKSYRSVYYFPGSPKPHSRHLGRVGEMTLEEARVKCRADRQLAQDGKDPKADNPSKSESYETAVKDYVKRVQIGELQNSSADECQRVLLADCEDWHQRPIGTIQPHELQRRLELVRDGDAEQAIKARPYLAVSLFARWRPFFEWCAKPIIGKLKTSPMIGIKKPWKGEQGRERDWFKKAAADKVIKTLWGMSHALTPTELSYLKVLLLLGKRKTALAKMRWEQIDQNWFWNAPQPKKKKSNKRLHSVPLPKLVQRILHPRQESGYVFPGDDGGHIAVNAAFQDKIIRAGAPADFFLHGCRHIAETKLAELKIPEHLRDRLFDHASGRGAGKTYDHHAYEAEMLDALEQWSAYVEGLVQPEGAVLMR